MKPQPLFRALTLVAFGLVGFGIAAPGCGQSVASCDDVCPATSAVSTCPNTCAAIQNDCSMANAGPDFQALLTCVSNAQGALDPLPELCEGDYAIVSKNCGVTGGLGPLDGGTDASGDAG